LVTEGGTVTDRNTEKVVIEAEGRDKGKTFLITEMFASQGESWAARVIMALADSGVQIPENYELLGMAGLAEIGFKAIAGLRWGTAEPLLQEMMSCVQIIVDPRNPAATTRPLMDEPGGPIGGGDYDIKEIGTRLKLRLGFWKLHMGFLSAALPSLPGGAKATAKKQSATATHQR
jgi:hypothetical protein